MPHMLSHRENYLRAIRFQGPETIPCFIYLPHVLFAHHGPDLERVLVRYPQFFPGFQPGKIDYANYPYPIDERIGQTVDPWGCTWTMGANGVVGTVTGHPLADWSAFEGYQPPPALPMRAERITGTWEEERARVEAARARGDLTGGGLYHGFFLLRLTYLRGFENLMCDLLDQPPRLARLIDMLKGHSAELLRHWLELDVDMITIAEDLGAQTGPLISPAMFRRVVTPVYRELLAPVKAAGKPIYLHCDGHVLALLDDFAAAGIDVLNVQDLVNGIDNLARLAKGRFCISLDVDRQKVVPFGSPRDIHALVEEEVRRLGSRAGGLMLWVAIYPPATLANVEAVCSAFEKYRHYWRA